ncbi:hypothetical protein [Cohnella herbarum]|uniref:Uncharacterized protein n=1 Tax=Cohnella herbarum TaxID=2728023 RepID=A0A7Z2VR12_9BACL|nr:hypothetical protein [Cohnella herbarum]QJD87888.1 hypothetical protein HH215_34990 [Cohnella herbarum]
MKTYVVELIPRPDLKYDSNKWATLLVLAYEKNEELYGVLKGIRSGGTRLRVGKATNGVKRWILKPDIDPSGKIAWASKSEYEEARDKYLMPHMEEIIMLLKKLEDRFPPSW